MKTIIVNAGPRKGWNTDLMLKEAQKGAEAAGAETEYIDLYDLTFSGCRSCLECKRKAAEKCKCYWDDDLSPVIEKILSADALIIGSPIYMGQPTAGFRALYERLIFCCLSYDGGKGYFNGKVNVGLVYTMNSPKKYFEKVILPSYRGTEDTIALILNGRVETLAAFETLQVEDYSKYNMAMFDEKSRKEGREKRFPEDLKNAYSLGFELSKPEDNAKAD